MLTPSIDLAVKTGQPHYFKEFPVCYGAAKIQFSYQKVAELVIKKYGYVAPFQKFVQPINPNS